MVKFNEKAKHLPINLVMCFTDFLLPYLIIIWVVPTIDTSVAFVISFYFYFYRVDNECELDVLKEKIKKLEESKINVTD